MELLEYYHLIRQRKWIVVACALVALGVVVVYQLLPPNEWQATGQLMMHESAADVLVYRAGELFVAPVTEFWSTFQTMAQSRTVLIASANMAGLTGPEIQRRLRPVETRQPRRGQILEVTAAAPTREGATKLTQSVMQYVTLAWNTDRLARARGVREAIRTTQRETRVLSQTEQADVLKARGAGLDPTEELTRAEADLAATRTEIEATRRGIAVAEARLQRARELIPPESQQRGGQPGAPAGYVDPRLAQLAELRSELADVLTRRKPEHPEVKALQARLGELESTLPPAGESNEAPQGSTAPSTNVVVVDAEVALVEAQAKLSLLQEHESKVKLSLPKLLSTAEKFRQAEKKAVQYEQLIDTAENQLSQVDAEVSRLTLLVTQSERQMMPEATAPDEENATPLDIEIVDPAFALRSPKTWKKAVLLAASAALLGTLLGAVVILGFHYVSTTFSNEVEARLMLQTRILGGIPRSDLPADEAGPMIQVH